MDGGYELPEYIRVAEGVRVSRMQLFCRNEKK
jgi:hypothetical protein